MNIKRPLAPGFLKKLDNFLLLNKPALWSTRTHLVFYYSLLFIAALSAVYYVVPDDARRATSVFVWVGFLVIICILSLVLWLVYLLRFNVFKRFGKITPVTTLIEFILYFIATSIIVSFCYVPLVIETAKANQDYTTQELVDDVNNINLKICQLEYDSIPKQWMRDTLRLVDTIPNRSAPSLVIDDATDVEMDTVALPVSGLNFSLIDTATLAMRIGNRDSLTRLNDSTYIFLTCPNYNFLDVYSIQKRPVKLLTSEQIFYKIMSPFTAPDKVKTNRELSALIDKYRWPDNERYFYEEVNPKGYEALIKKRYRLRHVEESMHHIAERKYRWSNFGQAFTMIWFYCSFAITLLVFAFRRSTARVFFLSLLSIVILTILTTLLAAFIRTNGFWSFLLLIFYFFVFTAISATSFGDHKRKAIKGIAVNLFLWMLPFVPLLFTGLYYQWLQDQYNSMVTSTLLIDYEAQSRHFLVAQISGPIIFLVILVLYLHKLYRKWYGLPAE